MPGTNADWLYLPVQTPEWIYGRAPQATGVKPRPPRQLFPATRERERARERERERERARARASERVSERASEREKERERAREAVINTNLGLCVRPQRLCLNCDEWHVV